jgi:hypothetical protein
MANVPTGTILSVVTAFAAAKTISAISNANPAVCTSTAHGFSNGDLVLLSSGWGRINNRAFEVKNVAVNTFEIAANTTDTSAYPAGSGTGSCIEASTLVAMTKVMNPQTSGGDPKTVTYKFMDADVDYSINDGFNATGYTFELDDDDSTAGYAALQSLTEVQTDTILKILLRNGSRIYIPGRVALNEVPVLQEGQINRVRVAFNGNGRATRYANGA